MDTFFALLDKVKEFLMIPIDIYGFQISFWSIFLFGIVLSFVGVAIGRAFHD